MLQPWHDIDWLDQALHVLVGGAIALTAGALLIWWAGLLLSMVVAVSREMYQHPWRCQAGCRTDLLFWMGGSLIGAGCSVVW